MQCESTIAITAICISSSEERAASIKQRGVGTLTLLAIHSLEQLEAKSCRYPSGQYTRLNLGSLTWYVGTVTAEPRDLGSFKSIWPVEFRGVARTLSVR